MPKRRGHGEGSIWQRQDGRWEARVALPADSSGKRRRRAVYGKTRAEVAEKLHELQHAKRSGISIEPSKVTVGQYLEDWIRDVAKPRVRASTLAEYQRHVDRVVEGAGRIPLKGWKPADIRALWSEFERAEIGARTRRAIHATMHRALADAVLDGLISVNPLSAVKSPREKRPEQKVLSSTQVRAILAKVDETETEQVAALVTLIAQTGLRIGEALGLRWQDVELGERIIHVRRNLAEISGRFVEQEPKTRAGRRVVTLPARAVERLRAHRTALGAVPLGSAFVFTDRKGGFLRRSNLLRRVWHPLLKASEVPIVGWHALRHAHATALLAAGEPVADVAARLGHRDATVTMSVYAHALPDRARLVADMVDEILG